MNKQKNTNYFKVINIILILTIMVSGISYYLFNFLVLSYSQVADSLLIKPLGNFKIKLNNKGYNEPLLKGVKINPRNPLELTLYIDSMDKRKIEDSDRNRLVRYFLGFLAIPEEKLWVNLSPQEKNRIIPQELSQLEIGQDFILEDYLLKQLTSRLTDPETKEGKNYWNKVNTFIYKTARTNKIPINAVNKVWIMPDKAVICEKKNQIFVKEARLKVMIEEDYLGGRLALAPNATSSVQGKGKIVSLVNQKIKQLFKQQIIPLIEKEINGGAYFSRLRQMYYTLILAAYFKDRLKNNTYYYQYINSSKIETIKNNHSGKIKNAYRSYLNSFSAGIYKNLTKEYSNKKKINKIYFSGGIKARLDNSLKKGAADIKDIFSGAKVIRDTIKLNENGYNQSDHSFLTHRLWLKISKLLKNIFLVSVVWVLLTTFLIAKISADEKVTIDNNKIIEVVSLITKEIGGRRSFVLTKIKNDYEIKTVAKLALAVVEDKVNLDILGIKGVSNRRFLGSFMLTVLYEYKQYRDAFIQEGAIEVFMRNLDKRHISEALSYLLGVVSEDKQKDIVRDLLVNIKNTDKNKEKLRKESFNVLASEYSPFKAIVSENGVAEFMGIIKDENDPLRIETIGILSDIVINNPDNLSKDKADAVVLNIRQLVNSSDCLLRQKASQCLSHIIHNNPNYLGLLKEINQTREKVNRLNDIRKSSEVVLLVYDDFSDDQSHGVQVISQIISEILGESINLGKLEEIPNDKERKKKYEEINKKLGLDINFYSQDKVQESISKAKEFLKNKGVILEIVSLDKKSSQENQLEQNFEKYRSKTVIVSMSLGLQGEVFGSRYSFYDPKLVNGMLPVNIINSDALFIIGAGNSGRPRIFTHPISDSVIAVGSVEKDSGGNWQRASYSEYGDISFLAEGIAPNGDKGTSYATPRITGILLSLLSKDKNMSVKKALEEMKKVAKPINSNLYKEGYLGNGVLEGVSANSLPSEERSLGENMNISDISSPIINDMKRERRKKKKTDKVADPGGITFSGLKVKKEGKAVLTVKNASSSLEGVLIIKEGFYYSFLSSETVNVIDINK